MYLILEYCSGGTLEHFILSNLSINLDQDLDSAVIKKIAAKILLIMEKLHSFGVVHRDLKVKLHLFSLLISYLQRKDLSNCLILELHMLLKTSFLKKLLQKLVKLKNSVKKMRRKKRKRKKAPLRVLKIYNIEDQHLWELLGYCFFTQLYGTLVTIERHLR